MTDIGKGDWVQVLENLADEEGVIFHPADSVRRIAIVDHGMALCDACGDRGLSFLFDGDPAAANEEWGGWCPCQVRPLRKPPEQSTPAKTGIKRSEPA